MHIFLTSPLPFNPNLKVVTVRYIAEILHTRVSHTWLIVRVKSFPLRPIAWPQYICDRRQMDKQTDGRTDDTHANSSTIT